jgi:hypothetical protein
VSGSSVVSISRVEPLDSVRVADHVKSTIKEIEGCSALKIYRSILISNENWKALGESAK